MKKKHKKKQNTESFENDVLFTPSMFDWLIRTLLSIFLNISSISAFLEWANPIFSAVFYWNSQTECNEDIHWTCVLSFALSFVNLHHV